MTLRCTIEIVPYGDENRKSEICRLDISNTGTVRDEGFGHQICSYSVKLFRHNNAMEQNVCGAPKWELIGQEKIKEHDRRDGAVALVKEACWLMEEAL